MEHVEGAALKPRQIARGKAGDEVLRVGGARDGPTASRTLRAASGDGLRPSLTRPVISDRLEAVGTKGVSYPASRIATPAARRTKGVV